jgi:hypothetical protein
MASGISNTFRLGGVATGVSALGAIFQQRISASLHAGLGVVPAHLPQAVAAGGIQAAARLSGGQRAVVGAASHAFVAGVDDILVVGAVCVLVGGLFAGLVRARDFRQITVAVPTPPIEPEAVPEVAG